MIGSAARRRGHGVGRWSTARAVARGQLGSPVTGFRSAAATGARASSGHDRGETVPNTGNRGRGRAKHTALGGRRAIQLRRRTAIHDTELWR